MYESIHKSMSSLFLFQKTYSINCESWGVRKNNKSLSGVHEEKTLKKSKKIELLLSPLLNNKIMAQSTHLFRYFSNRTMLLYEGLVVQSLNLFPNTAWHFFQATSIILVCILWQGNNCYTGSLKSYSTWIQSTLYMETVWSLNIVSEELLGPLDFWQLSFLLGC